MVVFDHRKKKDWSGTLNTAFARHNAYIPETYGLTAAELAGLMNAWRKQALTAHGVNSEQKPPVTGAAF